MKGKKERRREELGISLAGEVGKALQSGNSICKGAEGSTGLAALFVGLSAK